METTCFQVQTQDRQPVALAMQSLWLTGRVLPTGAVLRVRHEFSVKGRRTVESVYCFGLPRDAALRRFQIRTETLTAHSELRPTEDAVREYERGIAAGSLSALARQYGDGLVNLSVGNIRPGETVVVDLEIVAGVELHDTGLRLRFPFTLAPGYHRKAIAVSPEPGWGDIELPSAEFGDLLLPRWAADARPLHRVGFDLELDLGANVERVGSPSHRILVDRNRVALAAEGDLPDRDLVLDLEAGSGARILAGTAPNGVRHVSAVLPSTEFATEASGPRSVVLLIDRSGSMGGPAIEQAKSAALACLAALEPADLFGLGMFNSSTVLWRPSLAAATKDHREDAARFLAACGAEGGTELGEAIEAAAGLLGSSGGEVLLLTDGEVFGSEDLLRTARQAGIRLHTLGIGSASQDRTLSLLARETGGVSRFVTPRERVDQAALQMFSATGRAIATGIVAALEGELVVPPPERAYLGTPVALMGRLAQDAEPTLRIRWNEADGERHFAAQECAGAAAEALRLLEGARRLTDLDCRLTAESGRTAQRRIRGAMRQLSTEYGLASREMSLVAVMERKGDIAGDVPHTMIVPVGLPEDMEMEGAFASRSLCCKKDPLPSAMSYCMDFSPSVEFCADAMPMAAPPDPIFELAALLEDDGGMPGSDIRDRVRNSLAALEIFLASGDGFAPHARRLVTFLKGQALHAGDEARLRELESGGVVCPDPEQMAAILCRALGAGRV